MVLTQEQQPQAISFKIFNFVAKPPLTGSNSGTGGFRSASALERTRIKPIFILGCILGGRWGAEHDRLHRTLRGNAGLPKQRHRYLLSSAQYLM